jgi:hypothetical protein
VLLQEIAEVARQQVLKRGIVGVVDGRCSSRWGLKAQRYQYRGGSVVAMRMVDGGAAFSRGLGVGGKDAPALKAGFPRRISDLDIDCDTRLLSVGFSTNGTIMVTRWGTLLRTPRAATRRRAAPDRGSRRSSLPRR